MGGELHTIHAHSRWSSVLPPSLMSFKKARKNPLRPTDRPESDHFDVSGVLPRTFQKCPLLTSRHAPFDG